MGQKHRVHLSESPTTSNGILRATWAVIAPMHNPGQCPSPLLMHCEQANPRHYAALGNSLLLTKTTDYQEYSLLQEFWQIIGVFIIGSLLAADVRVMRERPMQQFPTLHVIYLPAAEAANQQLCHQVRYERRAVARRHIVCGRLQNARIPSEVLYLETKQSGSATTAVVFVLVALVSSITREHNASVDGMSAWDFVQRRQK
ncbi:hypothetical protein T265_03156 [Opisthorchis viverrini]|uniref:Uncharacterized protein n=1 Tax=Opisthorchis viverrini TaxID=6198 RepID=A0A074ZSM3_OPIVI|nr:hypothetical protein T265_03156 [Opisthorchis viverrini]KER30423.1 hypothetical protein T265_03156 [Opisthorchis viverrini]